MRKLAGVIAASAAGVVFALGGASAAVANGWDQGGYYPTAADCSAAIEAGIASGQWSEGKCVLFEGVYDLFTR